MRAERDFTVPSDPVHALGRSEVERLLAIGEPSLKNLSRVLRHRELWPDGFRWSYANCSSCAMGIANELWDACVTYPDSHAMVRAFGMGIVTTCRIFGGNDLWKTYGTLSYDGVTPEMVADKIDEYLALAGVK